MRALAALLAVVALPALAAPRQKIAVLDVRAVQGVSPGTATILTAIIAGDTAAAGYDVLSQADIGALIGFEKQKKMLGCGDDSSCLAEIGGALGAEYVMATQVGQIGSRFHLSLQVIDGKKGNVVARVSTFSERTEDALAATAQQAVAKALDSARERNDAARAAKTPAAAPAAAPIAVRTAAPTATATPSPTAATPEARSVRPERSVAGGDAESKGADSKDTPSEGGFFATRRPYVELRGGLGFNRVPLGTSSVAVKPFDGPGLGLRAGLKLTRAWAVEVGGANRKLRHQGGQVTWQDSTYARSGIVSVEDDIGTLSLGAGAVYSPRMLRVVSFAGDVGMARVTAKHLLKPPGTSVALPPGVTFAPIEERWNAWTPRFGAEVRVDYPLRWVTVGLRAGVDLTRTRRREIATDPYTAASEPWIPRAREPLAWLDAGWIVSYPIDLSVRYVF